MVFLGCEHTAQDRAVVTITPGNWKAARCPWCEGNPMVEVIGRPETGPQVIPDLGEHYNHSLGEVVRSRRHLQSLQKQHDCHDYEPTSDGRERLKYGREKLLHGR